MKRSLVLTVLLSLTVLPIVKGALVGLQWALAMHGFDPDAEEDTSEPFDDAAEDDSARSRS